MGGTAQNLSNQPLNLFWDHIFTKYNGKYYDLSYGIKSSDSYIFTTDDDLLDTYSQKALTGILYAKHNSAGEPIYDHLHSRQYINPENDYRLIPTITNASKHEYKIIDKSMQDHLDKDVYLY